MTNPKPVKVFITASFKCPVCSRVTVDEEPEIYLEPTGEYHSSDVLTFDAECRECEKDGNYAYIEVTGRTWEKPE